MIYFSGAPECGDSLAFESVTFADPRVAAYIESHVVPLRLRLQEQPVLAGQYGVRQTPALLLTDANGHVCHRIDGFLAPDDFLSRLELGVGAFECGLPEPQPPEPQHVDAAQTTDPGAEFAAQALYWKAAERFRHSGDTRRLRADWQAIAARFPQSVWALRMRLDDTPVRQAS